MVTTIQVDEKTLMILKKLRREMNAKSYAEAITKMTIERTKGISMAGSLRKYLKKGETAKDIIKELRGERKKSDRF